MGWSPWFFGFLLALMIGAWFGLKHLHHLGVIELAKTRQFGDLTFIPKGFQSHGWLRYSWDKIILKWPTGSSEIHGPEITLRILSTAPYHEHVHIHIDSSYTHLIQDTLPKDTSPKSRVPFDYIFPEITLPGRALITLGPSQVQVFENSWALDSLTIFNSQSKTLFVKAQNINGQFINEAINLDLSTNWENAFLTNTLRIHSYSKTNNDSIHIDAESPLDHLDDISSEISLFIENPQKWYKIPDQIPALDSITITAQASTQLRKKEYWWQGEIELNAGAYEFVPQGRFKIQAQGNHLLKINGNVNWIGEYNESIQLNASYENHSLRASGNTYGLTIPIGSNTLPLDAEIKNLYWKNDSAYVDLVTGDNSKIKAWVSSIKDPTAAIDLDISPTEPWALTWTGENLSISPPSTITGNYRRGVLTANLKTGLPSAFKTTAEVFEADLMVTSKGVYFDNGTFLTRKIPYYFTGEVVWDPEQSYYQFEIEQENKGNIQVYGDFDGAIRLHVTNVSTLKLPVMDTSLLQGINANLTGTWDHNFSEEQGEVKIRLESDYKGFPIDLSLHARQQKDSLIVEEAVAHAQGNALTLKGLALLDSINGPTPIWAELKTQEFSLPAFLKGLNDTTLREATLFGQLRWDKDSGLNGKFSIPKLSFLATPADELRLERISLVGEKDQAALSGRLFLGKDGLWNSEIEVQVKDLFSATRKASAALATDFGGVFWTETTIDSLMNIQGDFNVMGNWYLPGNDMELKNTRFSSSFKINPAQKLQGIQAKFQLDSAIFVANNFELPFNFKGDFNQGILSLNEMQIFGHDKTKLLGAVIFDVENKLLQKFALISHQFNLHYQGIHHLYIYNFSTHAKIIENAIDIALQAPKIEYRLKDPSIGDVEASIRASANLTLPQNVAGHSISAPRIDGRIDINRMIYKKDFPIELDPKLFDIMLGKAMNAFGKFAGKSSQTNLPEKAKVSSAKSSPVELDLRITDPGLDTIMVKTNVATVPLTLDLQVQGTLDKPLLNGDINSAGTGFVGIDALATFELEQLRIWWQDESIKKGQIEIKMSKDVPYCKQSEEGRIEVCAVNLNVTGVLTKPVPLPYANCAVETTPAQIYYNVFLLGCFPDAQEASTDPNGIANRILGMATSKVLNSSLGGDYFGDIDFHLQLLGQSNEAQDSNAVRIPIKLDRWVKNLRLEMAYSQNTSTGTAQSGAQSYELGLKYSMPVLDSSEVVENHIDPTLNFSGNIVAKRNQTNTQENLLERKAAVDYRWKFWDMCLFGIGFCESKEEGAQDE